MPEPIQFPDVNLNGDTASSLLEAHSGAYNTIRQAQGALARCAPHGRNYLPQDPNGEKLARAIAQHRARQIKLEEILSDLDAIMLHIDSGGAA